MMSTELALLVMIPVLFGVGGMCWRTDDHEHAKASTAACRRTTASHFETLNHLMLRRSPSARRGVMSCRSHPINGKRGEIR